MNVRAAIKQVIPASLYGGATAYPLLADIQGRLDGSAKAALYEPLARRFPPLVAQALAVKISNLFLAQRHFRARSISVGSRPFGLVIDPSNMCQLACPGCVHSARNESLSTFDWPKGTLSETRYRALLELYGPFAVGAYFCNYGEPLLNLATPRLIRLAKAYLLHTALSTSLSVIKLDAEAYVESGLDFMVISIDGATQPVYQQFRRNGNLELALENIRKLVAAKQKLSRRTPLLSWNFLAFEHNAHEIEAAGRLARALGVDFFRVVNPFDVGWDDPAIRPAAVRGEVRRLNWSSISAEAENFNPFPDELDHGPIVRAFEEPVSPLPVLAGDSGHTCHWLYQNMVMDATGRILPCCGGPPADRSLVFGQFDGAAADAYNSDHYRQARAWFADGVRGDNPPHCTKCDWDHATVNIGPDEIRRYFRAADAAYFDRRSLRLLSSF